ncbi:hypothetical protein [Syntrophorhabdus aromaticivorans]|uniref:hypothetical protein n=1 Tax=Syntrophorhabdus aromaticivorans TaxID=328301 RepID=UPI00049180F8|nr:hypothetical protein [Syntrophorhabdus aromaticivorans]
MNQIFLGKLYGALEGATVRELQGLHDFFGKYHVWDWTGPEHVKAILWLRGQPSGEFSAKQISASIGVVGPQGQLWPGPEQIPRIIAGLQQIKLLRVTWPDRGSRETLPFILELDPLRRETEGPLWGRLAPVILDASYKEITALAALYAQTNLAEQPGFYLRALCWCAAVAGIRVSDEEFSNSFAEIKKQTRFDHDARNGTHGVLWCKQKGLINIRWDERGFYYDITPLRKFGFTTNEKGGKHE